MTLLLGKWFNSMKSPLGLLGKLICLSLVSAVLAPLPARGGVISSLFNTGVLDDGSLAPVRSTELHYTATFQSADLDNPNASGVPSEVKVPSFFPESWVANTSDSRWIWAVPPFTDPNSTALGTYDYVLSFDLSGFDASTARIAGRWAADTQGLDVLVNGNATHQTAMASSFTDFTIDPHALLAHANTLDFRVLNGIINPEGIQVEFTDRSAAEAPEPATLTLCGIGLAILVVRGMKPRKRLAFGW